MKTSLTILSLLIFGLLAGTVQAQDAKPFAKAIYTSFDGMTHFVYPAGWAVEEDFETGAIELANNQAVMDLSLIHI